MQNKQIERINLYNYESAFFGVRISCFYWILSGKFFNDEILIL